MMKSLVEIITAINIVIGGNAYHSGEHSFNENNNMQGIELEAGTKGAYLKWCKNSFGEHSSTVGMFYKKCTDGKLKLCGGVSGGLATGYKTNFNNILPYATGDLGVESKYISASFNCIPTLTACMYQIKLRYEFK